MPQGPLSRLYEGKHEWHPTSLCQPLLPRNNGREYMVKHLHEKLGITFREYMALLATRELLARGDVEHETKTITCAIHNRLADGRHAFTMSHPGAVVGCGTIGCIGGYMGFVMGYSSMPAVTGGHPLYALFYPETKYGATDHNWRWITPKIAVKAIDSFLKTGKPNWNALVPARLRHND